MAPADSNAAPATAAFRAELNKFRSQIHAMGERLEKLHEQQTLEQLTWAREVVDLVKRQMVPHFRAEEYSLYPAADWAAGEGSKLTETARHEHVIVARRLEALEKAIAQGAASGRLMHVSYGLLGFVAGHLTATEEVVLPYLDKAFDAERFEREVLTPLRADRAAKR
ncbi:MAG TPA: hemerythrin domain-containing protein [Acidobacteriota bacterium]|nr:hemerythrin domain-containing protein [Acidobacteriota bacterium]